ncbi:RPS27A [Candida pseudojiufengensis]|uniref:RPS27A n=1 Tax=Candida pseudojiufengensis TaxID=497109 RepID=UPI0022250533|nr:RPS27A [Candida pseudojiufengensis]KAI5960406.1 RPS27A [Candida pseudojiufengensis]
MVLVQDLLHPNPSTTKNTYKLKKLVQEPNSYFIDIKCPGCFNIVTIFSHAQTSVSCEKCSNLLCTPTGGKAKLVEGSSFRRK